MEIANQFQKVRFLLAEDRLIAVLEEMTVTSVATIEGARVV